MTCHHLKPIVLGAVSQIRYYRNALHTHHIIVGVRPQNLGATIANE